MTLLLCQSSSGWRRRERDGGEETGTVQVGQYFCFTCKGYFIAQWEEDKVKRRRIHSVKLAAAASHPSKRVGPSLIRGLIL